MSVTATIVGAHFGMYHPDEIMALSVKKIVSHETVDTLGNPFPGGLSDPALGTADYRSTCTTCHLGHSQCPGHMGHLELGSPVYNPVIFTTLRDLVMAKCLSCHCFRGTQAESVIFLAKLTLLDSGLVNEALDLESTLFAGEHLKIEEDEETPERPQGDASTVTEYVTTALTAAGVASTRPSLWRVNHSHVSEVRDREIAAFIKLCKSKKKCERCDAVCPTIRVRGGFKLFVDASRKDTGSTEVFGGGGAAATKQTRYVPPTEAEKHMKLLWVTEGALLKRLFSAAVFWRREDGVHVAGRRSDPGMFFIRLLAVTPNRFRPPNVLSGRLVENDQTLQYQNIMKANDWLLSITRGEALDMNLFVRAITRLQATVAALIDNRSIAGLTSETPGIRQLLEKKEGLFRMFMMGKRVNYSARSVISPDPNIETSEIGVPVHFAQRLSYPQPVTAMNIEQMREAVINGAKHYPGANYVVDPDGTVVHLEHRTRAQRVSISRSLLSLGDGPNPSHGPVFGRKVGRHLRDGDIVLINRQPTLHKPSIMAHRVRVLHGDRVLRLHYANCSTYNADFDGDEINLHFPQSELARAEGYLIASTDQQYCVPSSGMPIRGLIQDHVVGGVQLTKKGVFLTRGQYMQLVFAACAGVHSGHAIEPVPPAIIKPVPLWTGKQVITTVLRHVSLPCQGELHLVSKARVKGTAWQPGGPTYEDEVIFRESALLVGVMDRSQFGATAYGLVHAVNELFGPNTAELLLTALGRLFTSMLASTGFTMGIDDCLVSRGAERERANLLDSTEPLGVRVAKEFCGGEGEPEREAMSQQLTRFMTRSFADLDRRGALLDGVMRTALNAVASKVVDVCIPRGQVKPFPANSLALMTQSGAKGSAVNHSQISCLLGQQDVEGRRVPRMVNGKTLPCFLPFDASSRSGGFITQRFLTGLELPEYFFHCMAGREGLIDTAVKTSSSGYLQRCLIKHLESIRVHYDSTVRQDDGSIVQFLYGDDGLDVSKTAWLAPNRLPFHASNYQGFLHRLSVAKAADHLDEVPRIRRLQRRGIEGKNDPVTSMFPTHSTVGCTSERFYRSCEDFLKANPTPEGIVGDGGMRAKDKFRALMSLKYVHCLAQPGEAVGLLAAQSVGEPSTQMTLNTFHLAGVAEAKVTLGIPRLREILMSASKNISAPSMVLPLHPGRTRVDALRVAARIDKITVAEVVDTVSVNESVVSYGSGGLGRNYTLTLAFKELDTIEYILGLSWAAIRRSVKKRLLPVILRAIVTQLKARDQGATATTRRRRPAAAAVKEEGRAEDNDDSSDDEDADEDDARLAMRRRMRGHFNADAEEAPPAAPPASDDEAGSDAESEHEDAYTGVGAEYLESIKFSRNGRCVITLRFDPDKPRILMLEVFRNAANRAIVRQEPGIERCHVISVKVSDGSERVAIQTEGVDLALASRLRERVDVREVTCNSIHDLLETYGVEAARAGIMNEVGFVFGMYGINVDKRHLSLIADYCTHEGGYKGFNRHSMNVCPSPFTRMSYETTARFLTASALAGDRDAIESPSGCIVVGHHAHTGTGACDIRMPIR